MRGFYLRSPSFRALIDAFFGATMTIRMPETNICDRFLNLLGKKRGVKFPNGAYDRFDPYVYAKAYKENFWKALLRPTAHPLPEGMIDLSLIEDLRK